MNLGATIVSLRKERGLKQYILAKHIGISPTSMSLIEANKQIPEHSTMKKIADSLEVPLSVIYMLSIDNEDIPLERLKVFWAILPGLKVLLKSLY